MKYQAYLALIGATSATDGVTAVCQQACDTNQVRSSCVKNCIFYRECINTCGYDAKCNFNCDKMMREEETNTQKSACGIDEQSNYLGPNRCSVDSECDGDRTCSTQWNYGFFCEGVSGCDRFKQEEETNTQMGVCRNACGTENAWSPCVIGCKIKQVKCARTCDRDFNCMVDCVTDEPEEEEETNTQLTVCINACGTNNVLNPCVIGCKVKYFKCARKCDGDLHCIVDCVTDEPEEEEETNTQLRVCRNACGTDNVWNPCVIGCKVKQAKCFTQCGTDVNCGTNCLKFAPEAEEETNAEQSFCERACRVDEKDDWKTRLYSLSCVNTCKGNKPRCDAECGDDATVWSYPWRCRMKCQIGDKGYKFMLPGEEEEATEMLDVSMSRWGERDDMEMMRDLNYLAMEVTGRSVDDFKKLMGDLTGVEDFVM